MTELKISLTKERGKRLKVEVHTAIDKGLVSIEELFVKRAILGQLEAITNSVSRTFKEMPDDLRQEMYSMLEVMDFEDIVQAIDESYDNAQLFSGYRESEGTGEEMSEVDEIARHDEESPMAWVNDVLDEIEQEAVK